MIKGTFTSVWESEGLIETDAELDFSTGEIFAESVDVDIDNDFLDCEYFTDSEGNVYDVCPECHNFILKDKIVNGKKVQFCSNCD